MLNGVHLRRVHYRFLIGAGEPQIEGGDGLAAHGILPGNIEPGLQADMVNGKAGNFFHKNPPGYFVFFSDMIP